MCAYALSLANAEEPGRGGHVPHRQAREAGQVASTRGVRRRGEVDPEGSRHRAAARAGRAPHGSELQGRDGHHRARSLPRTQDGPREVRAPGRARRLRRRDARARQGQRGGASPARSHHARGRQAHHRAQGLRGGDEAASRSRRGAREPRLDAPRGRQRERGARAARERDEVRAEQRARAPESRRRVPASPALRRREDGVRQGARRSTRPSRPRTTTSGSCTSRRRASLVRAPTSRCRPRSRSSRPTRRCAARRRLRASTTRSTISSTARRPSRQSSRTRSRRLPGGACGARRLALPLAMPARKK